MNGTDSGKRSQVLSIQRHLEHHGSITPMVALQEYGCMRLGARIWDLKDKGLPIESSLVDVGNGKKAAQYRLVKVDAQGQTSLF